MYMMWKKAKIFLKYRKFSFLLHHFLLCYDVRVERYFDPPGDPTATFLCYEFSGLLFG